MQLSSTLITIGQILVDCATSRQEITSCLTAKNRTYIRQGEWQLTNHKFKTSDCQKLLSICKQCRIVKLLAYNNLHPRLLLLLEPVGWPNLQQLGLANNNIQSVSPLSYLTAPCLQVLDLSNNLITSTDQFPNYAHLLYKFCSSVYTSYYIVDNPISEIRCIDICGLKLKNLDIFGYLVKIEDYSFIFKYLSEWMDKKNKHNLIRLNLNQCMQLADSPTLGQLTKPSGLKNIQISLIDL